MSRLVPWSAEESWSCEARHVAEARIFVGRHLVGHGLEEYADVLRLIVSELVTNAVLHAGTAFSVTLGQVDGELTLTVQDGSDVMPQELPPADSDSLSVRGRGLQMVEALSDAWGVTAEVVGKSVWATLGTHPALSGGLDGDRRITSPLT